jgi:hypothetical protein
LFLIKNIFEAAGAILVSAVSSTIFILSLYLLKADNIPNVCQQKRAHFWWISFQMYVSKNERTPGGFPNVLNYFRT